MPPPLLSATPYTPTPPYHGTLWPRLLNAYLPRYLRRHYQTQHITIKDAEKLKSSLNANHGVLLTPNHSRDEDPLILSALSRAVSHPFFVVASAHLFTGPKLQTFLLRRAGAFSIYREGMDKQAVQTSIEILESAQRPLVIFPEGHISRTNDRLTPMLEGTALIARQAAKKRAKENKKVVVHPIAIRYAFHFDIDAAATRALDEIEQRLTWPPSRKLPLPARFQKVGAGLLALKELQYLNHTHEGPIPQRIDRLINAILTPLEDQYANANHDGHPVARVKRLRSAILPTLIAGDLPEPEQAIRWRQLDDATFAQQLYHYPPNYVTDSSPPSHIVETLERFAEDLTGESKPLGPSSATITVGDPLEVPTARESRTDTDPLMTSIESSLRTMLNIPNATTEDTENAEEDKAEEPQMNTDAHR